MANELRLIGEQLHTYTYSFQYSPERDAGVTATANKESYHDNLERLPRQSAGCKHDNSHDKNSLYGSTAL